MPSIRKNSRIYSILIIESIPHLFEKKVKALMAKGTANEELHTVGKRLFGIRGDGAKWFDCDSDDRCYKNLRTQSTRSVLQNRHQRIDIYSGLVMFMNFLEKVLETKNSYFLADKVPELKKIIKSVTLEIKRIDDEKK